MEKLLKKYRIGTSRLRSGSQYGLEIDEAGGIHTLPEEGRHLLFLGALDAGVEDWTWGRFVLSASLPHDMVLVIHALASDEDRILRDGHAIRTDDFCVTRIPMHNLRCVCSTFPIPSGRSARPISCFTASAVVFVAVH